jgi:hypothetical protein
MIDMENLKIEHYSKHLHYTIDIELDEKQYIVHLDIPQTDEGDSICAVIDMDTMELVDNTTELYSTIATAIRAEVQLQEATSATEALTEIQRLSDPLTLRDAEALVADLTEINRLASSIS